MMFGRRALIVVVFLEVAMFGFGRCIISPVSVKSTSTDFIKASCTRTIYPQLCYSSLVTHASAIRTNPKLLAGTALAVALVEARSTSASMVKLSKVHGLKPREVLAMRDCMETLGNTVYELKRSIAEMDAAPTSNSKAFELMISDVQTWVSAALTDETTCSDGFSGKMMNGELKTIVRKQIEKAAQLTSNALALVNSYASLHNHP